MTKRDELAAWLAELPESVVDAWHAQAANLRVTMAPADGDLDAETASWLDASAADMLANLEAVEADVPAAQRDAWIKSMMAGAVPVRFDPATGEVVEVST